MTLHALQQQSEYEVVGLLTTITDEYERISMHGVRCSLLRHQVASLRLPLYEARIPPQASNEIYEAAMESALTDLKEDGIRKVAFGDIFLEDLRQYREALLGRLGLKCLFPIWNRDTGELVREFLNVGFKAITSCIDPRVLDERFVGREIDAEFLADLPEDADPCGENGEFHSFVFDGPIFDRIVPIQVGETVSRDSFLFCDLLSVDSDLTERN